MRSRRSRYLLVLGAVGVITICAAGSPLLLAAVTNWTNLDWPALANIGQAYGAISAILSALAVLGVAASLIYQGQQLRLTRQQHIRAVQRELIMKMLDQPDLAVTVGVEGGADVADPRRNLFILAWLQYLHLAYEGGVRSESAFAEDSLVPALRGEAVRSYWARNRKFWHATSRRSQRSFAALVDTYYEKVIPVEPAVARRPANPVWNTKTARTAAGMVAAGVLTGWFIGKGYRRRSNRR
jgi:hypothetical protein